MLVVAARDCVPYGIVQQSVLGEPPAGRSVQLTDPIGMPGNQTGAQCVGEEVVVAIPPALVVERDDEQVLALEGLQHRLTVGATSQGAARVAIASVTCAGRLSRRKVLHLHHRAVDL